MPHQPTLPGTLQAEDRFGRFLEAEVSDLGAARFWPRAWEVFAAPGLFETHRALAAINPPPAEI